MTRRRIARVVHWFLFFAAQALASSASGSARLYAQDGLSASQSAVEGFVSVATRRLPRGTVLSESDIGVARVAHRRHAGSRLTMETLMATTTATTVATTVATTMVTTAVTAGWITRRVVLAGEVLRPPAVAPAPLVVAGQIVQFTYVQDDLRLTLSGVATAAASLGETVDVRLGAKRRVAGIVSGPARVTATDSSRIS